MQRGALPPDQVLQKATEAAGTLSSAHFVIHATVNGHTSFLPGSLDGTVDANGDMQNGGNQLSLTVNADIKRTADTSNTFNVQADVVVAGQNDAYMRLNALTINPESSLLPTALVSQLLNQWWHMPARSSGSTVQQNVTPDPELLRMQTQVITVSKDDGMTSINGHSAYHYDVSIDQSKLATYLAEIARRQNAPSRTLDLSSMNAQGQIWIDADTFLIHQLVWDISSKDPAQPFHASITVTLTKQNQPVTIVPPANAKPFPAGNLGSTTQPSSSSASTGGR